MLTEQYCSFETAKLLKEKGFDEPCHAYYEDNGTFRESYSAHAIRNITNPCFFGIAAPTQQMVMRWLREAHKLHIIIQYGNVSQPKEPQMQYWFEVVDANGQYCDGNIVDGNTSYEEACEAGIQY